MIHRAIERKQKRRFFSDGRDWERSRSKEKKGDEPTRRRKSLKEGGRREDKESKKRAPLVKWKRELRREGVKTSLSNRAVWRGKTENGKDFFPLEEGATSKTEKPIAHAATRNKKGITVRKAKIEGKHCRSTSRQAGNPLGVGALRESK